MALQESNQGDLITTITDTPIVDSDLNSYGLALSSYYGLQVSINGITDITTSDVVLILYYDHIVYYQNSNDNFYSKLNLSNIWRQTTDPRISIPKSCTIAVPGSITANVPFAVSGTLQGYTITPVLQYQDNSIIWNSFPPGSSTTVGNYSFVHPGMSFSDSSSISIRDKNITNVGVTSHILEIVLAAESTEGTPLLRHGSPSIVDSSGNFWTIDNDGFIYINGVIDLSANKAIMLYYSNHMVFYQDIAQSWYKKINTTTPWRLTVSPYLLSPSSDIVKAAEASQSLQSIINALNDIIYEIQPIPIID